MLYSFSSFHFFLVSVIFISFLVFYLRLFISQTTVCFMILIFFYFFQFHLKHFFSSCARLNWQACLSDFQCKPSIVSYRIVSPGPGPQASGAPSDYRVICYCAIINKTVQIPMLGLNIASIVNFIHNKFQTEEKDRGGKGLKATWIQCFFSIAVIRCNVFSQTK